MQYQGVLKKMMTENSHIVQYYLDLESDFINMNQLLNRNLEITFVKYRCMNCHIEKEIYRQGFCKNCFFLGSSLNSSSVLGPSGMMNSYPLAAAIPLVAAY